MKKRSVTLGLITTILLSTALVGCSNGNSDSKSSKSNDEKTEKAEKSTQVKTGADAKNNKWSFKNDVFSAGILTYKLTKSEVRDSSEDGKKVLVIYTDVTNNSNKEQDPSNIYIVSHAYQKTDTANKQLLPGMVALDENADSPLQKYEDALNDKLLPGKTTQAVMIYSLENDSPVKVSFENSDFKTLGSKTYNVQQ
ncbi:DUF5067 domain-containing protein [Companilactobacillus mishanensis]|uniref:DUF5067 domain-containing protein n=1 Tax=Companilactobacillus mishanensis TaxID=2486008 RepID=A0A5P0ZEN6_9LACO|nr:DUF5067 domain-containing protein [Companilactobacillus mishanensis]MQS51445.1 DUF5067 domain-containing protein [Companilactobacillus mishanensis]